ncbi:hypothetical protein [Alienimonas chondri]|uniref:Uncharacterized protein n=1 Tax=Alienimonas chondri TaxID=2681879 RepID=A0ABX1V964_9PLAN|nr:hypothetical protein [Alienimonas chondri]NNJ24642.1 hypothetical protein [Alienimonas chondri]
MSDVIHPKYLPYTREELTGHFADEKHLNQLVDSSRRLTAYVRRFEGLTGGFSLTPEVRRERQLERDERAWTVSALKAVYDANAMPALLDRAFAHTQGDERVGGWAEKVGGEDSTLRFEVGLYSPEVYREALRRRYDERDASVALVPYISDAAAGRTKLEGATRADGVLSGQSATVVFEAKLLSDSSSHVTFDPLRNQIARNLDILLDEKAALKHEIDERYFVLLTPETFRRRPRSRHYGLLLREYVNNPDALKEDLPHRDPEQVIALARRIGWATFEECRDLVPGACGWLPDGGAGGAA